MNNYLYIQCDDDDAIYLVKADDEPAALKKLYDWLEPQDLGVTLEDMRLLFTLKEVTIIE